jgi:hypothetical protein
MHSPWFGLNAGLCIGLYNVMYIFGNRSTSGLPCIYMYSYLTYLHICREMCHRRIEVGRGKQGLTRAQIAADYNSRSTGFYLH